MTASIKQIIEIAIDLDSGVIKDYLYEMQKQSNLNPKVFFGLMKSEIDKIKIRDKEEIDDLKQKGLMLFYKYDLLDIVIDGIFEDECSKIILTTKMAKKLGYVINPNPIELKKVKRTTNQKKKSYVWKNNPEKELPELYNLMIVKYKLIALDTTINQFTATFTGQPIESIIPIKWHQENASELLYFIQKLEQSDNIEHNPKMADYQKMTSCFVKPDGNKFIAVWKSLKTNIEISLSSEKQRAVDELINNFL